MQSTQFVLLTVAFAARSFVPAVAGAGSPSAAARPAAPRAAPPFLASAAEPEFGRVSDGRWVLPGAAAALAAAALGAAAASAPRGASRAAVSRRTVLRSAANAAALALAAPALARPAAVRAELEEEPCDKACFRECDALVPGNAGYCRKQCDDYCAAGNSAVPGDAGNSAVPGDAGEAEDRTEEIRAACEKKYSTDKARAYCVADKTKKVTKADAAPSSSLQMNNGIFGDSGVSYSKNVEDLFGTVFGATRQNKDVRKADVGAYASDISNAAKDALFGK